MNAEQSEHGRIFSPNHSQVGSIETDEFQQRVLPDSFYTTLEPQFQNGTYVWSYVTRTTPWTYPGVTLEARVGTPTSVRFINDLQNPDGSPPYLQSLIPVDQTIHWADPLATGVAVMLNRSAELLMAML